MAKYTTLTSLFTAIANSLRTKTGGTDAIVADDFPSVIDEISTGITPTGTKQISSNGTHDVTSYASATVNVPTGITPSGTKEITANGEHDITNFAKVNVNVPITAVSRVITIDSDKTNTTLTLVAGDEFAKEHYTHTGFKAFLVPLFTVPNTVGAVGIVAQGNIDISSATSTNATVYGIRGYHSAAATFALAALTTPVTTNTSHVSFRFTSAGNVNLYMTTTYKLLAGSYLLVMACND